MSSHAEPPLRSLISGDYRERYRFALKRVERIRGKFSSLRDRTRGNLVVRGFSANADKFNWSRGREKGDSSSSIWLVSVSEREREREREKRRNVEMMQLVRETSLLRNRDSNDTLMLFLTIMPSIVACSRLRSRLNVCRPCFLSEVQGTIYY